MDSIDSDLRRLLELYRQLGEALGGPSDENRQTNTAAATDKVLQCRESILRLERMNARIVELAAEWASLRSRLDPASRAKTRQMAESVLKQAGSLLKIANQRVHEIQAGRSRIEQELTELHKGKRYLEAVKPVKGNYPKFIDSLG